MKRTFEQGVTILDTEGFGGAKRASSGRQGVHWDGRVQKYYARWAKINLGGYKNFDEAVAVREAAEKHAKAGTLDVWLKEHRAKRK